MVIEKNTTLDRTFHALADSTRRGMVTMLAKEGFKTAGELGAPFDISQPAASKHLKVLENAGLVIRKRHGRTHAFSLNSETLGAARGWLERHQAFWAGSMDQLEALLETEGDT
ncbi:MAG: helix-turn-helix transcriptional regulator [Alphaproteobacteria bacterium]|nr:helix-turn-helix transcriptional regulator [Alphaproteobacteria bacterium]